MLLVSYDISDDKLRTHFAKFLSKYGYRLQYSIFEISNSPKICKCYYGNALKFRYQNVGI